MEANCSSASSPFAAERSPLSCMDRGKLPPPPSPSPSPSPAVSLLARLEDVADSADTAAAAEERAPSTPPPPFFLSLLDDDSDDATAGREDEGDDDDFFFPALWPFFAELELCPPPPLPAPLPYRPPPGLLWLSPPLRADDEREEEAECDCCTRLRPVD